MRPLDYDSLHINDKQRFKTDIPCTIIGAAFALTMFIAACVMWNRCTVLSKSENFDKQFSFYSGSNSQAICGEGKFIYYENYQDLTVIIPLFRRCNVLINVQYSTQSIRDCAFQCKVRRNNSFSAIQTQLSGSLAKSLNGCCCLQLELVQLLGFFDYPL